MRFRFMISLAAPLLAAALAPAGASAEPTLYECQKPVTTGVEVYGLRNISRARACPPALELYAWENSSATHIRALYGCRRPVKEAAGYPYLKLRSFRGWTLSLQGKYGIFTMSRGASSFHVGGTDFPLNCS
jgi:hypothetical protein